MQFLAGTKVLTSKAQSSTSQDQSHWRFLIFCQEGQSLNVQSGLRVWRLNEVELKGLRTRLKEAPEDHILASPRVITGDGAQAGLFCGQSRPINGKPQQVGCPVNLLPRIRGSTTDLTAVVVFSEVVTNPTISSVDAPSAGSVSIQTNFAFAGRFQLPRESAGIFVLQSVPGASNPKQIALIVSCKVLESKSDHGLRRTA